MRLGSADVNDKAICAGIGNKTLHSFGLNTMDHPLLASLLKLAMRLSGRSLTDPSSASKAKAAPTNIRPIADKSPPRNLRLSDQLDDPRNKNPSPPSQTNSSSINFPMVISYGSDGHIATVTSTLSFGSPLVSGAQQLPSGQTETAPSKPAIYLPSYNDPTSQKVAMGGAILPTLPPWSWSGTPENDGTRITVTLMGESEHLVTEGYPYNSHNEGAIVAIPLPGTDHWAVGGGGYMGSYNKRIFDFGFSYMPLEVPTKLGEFSTGLNVGLVEGYRRYDVRTEPGAASLAFSFSPKIWSGPHWACAVGGQFVPPMPRGGVINTEVSCGVTTGAVRRFFTKIGLQP